MSFSLATIKSMVKVIKDDYGRDVSVEQAEEILNTLVPYYDTLAKIYYQIKSSNLSEK